MTIFESPFTAGYLEIILQHSCDKYKNRVYMSDKKIRETLKSLEEPERLLPERDRIEARKEKERKAKEAEYKQQADQVEVEDKIMDIQLLDGRVVPCYPAEHVASNTRIDKNSDRQLFYSNVNLFLDNAEVILNDSRMFLAPVYCGKTCFVRSVPTLGIYVEFWARCRELSVEKSGLPIYYMSGNPMTGSHACAALTPQGITVKPILKIRFIDLLKLFESINKRYCQAKGVCKVNTLEEVVCQLKHSKYGIHQYISDFPVREG